MQHKPFNELPGQRYWDRYQAFYKEFHTDYRSTHGLFSLFETGELRVNIAAPDPSDRYHNKTLNIELYSTRDGYRKFTTPDGEDIKKAWLFYYGTQYLLIDHDTKRAVQLRSYQHNAFSEAPNNLKDSVAYIPGVGRNPVGVPIKVSSPRPDKYKEIEHWCREVVDACTTIERVAPCEGWVGRWTSDRPLLPTEALLSMRPEEYVHTLDAADIKHIATYKFNTPRKNVDYPYLLLKE